ncbi:MAG TPA: hypothetical protein VGV35_18420 [Bryobacteraceae bacterium]|nr:hypothetical protein [Bryobacteraceae bacterium]
MNPPGFACPRRTGFLFPHACDRLSPVGCPDCNGGQVNDPFAQRTDRYGYDQYNDYSNVSSFSGRDDFTEADGETLVRRRRKYEEDMTGS